MRNVSTYALKEDKGESRTKMATLRVPRTKKIFRFNRDKISRVNKRFWLNKQATDKKLKRNCLSQTKFQIRCGTFYLSNHRFLHCDFSV